MLTRYVFPGDKVELQALERVKFSGEQSIRKIYNSKVYDVLSDDRLEIAMPMEKTRLVLLSVGAEYEICFYTATGLYQCVVKVVERYKSDNKYGVLLELVTNLRKYQRREFYRLNCALEMDSRLMRKDEIAAFEDDEERYIDPELPMQRGIIVDISGGGMRFVGNFAYEADRLICCKFNLIAGGREKEYLLFARVIAVREIEGKPGLFEHRVQFAGISVEEQEEIIRYIFEEERKHRKKEKDFE